MHSGFSMITAIFLLVVLGTLGTMMVTFFAAQQQSSALDVMGSRAYQASRAGVEWAAYYVSKGDTATCNAGKTFAAGTLGGDLSPFTVTVTCSSVSFVDGGAITIYSIASTATFGGTPGNVDYVERTINVTMGK